MLPAGSPLLLAALGEVTGGKSSPVPGLQRVQSSGFLSSSAQPPRFILFTRGFWERALSKSPLLARQP